MVAKAAPLPCQLMGSWKEARAITLSIRQPCAAKLFALYILDNLGQKNDKRW
jgi:hypothetical protein